MLDALKRGVGNFLAKVLLGLLVIAFAVWGISDVFRGYGQRAVARVGKVEISSDDLRQAYQDEVTAMSRRFGRRLTPEQAKLLGLEGRALSRLITSAAIDQHARDLGLSIPDSAIADSIKSNPAFQGVDGTFSSQRFREFLRQNGISEGRFLRESRNEEIRDQVTDTLLGSLSPPQAMIDVLHRYRDEKRSIEYFTPDFSKLVQVPEPEESKLKEYYEQNKRQFVTPEYRKANLLLLTRDAVKAATVISEEEIKSTYDATKESFNIPEKRRIQQIAFPDRIAADKAFAELSKAKDFKEAAAKLGFKESDYDLGLLARRDMIDPKIAEAAFALKKNELSKPVEGQFALVLLRVTDIEAGKQRTFDEVKNEIRERLADERAGAAIQDLHDKIEDARSAGKPLKEIGETLKLVYREVAETDRSGKSSDGKPAIEGASAAQIAQAVFTGAVGVEAEPVELSDGGYAWFDVVSVTPERQKAFEEVTADVKTAYLEVERRNRIAAEAAKMAERIGKGETMEAVAKAAGVAKVEKTDAITRVTVPQGLTQNAVQQAFALPKGGAGSALTADGTSRTIFRVAEIVPAGEPTAEQVDRLKTDLVRQLQTDVLSEYVAALQTRYGVSINDAALRQALGTGGE